MIVNVARGWHRHGVMTLAHRRLSESPGFDYPDDSHRGSARGIGPSRIN